MVQSGPGLIRDVCLRMFLDPSAALSKPEHQFRSVIFSTTLGRWEAERGCFRWDGGRVFENVHIPPSPVKVPCN